MSENRRMMNRMVLSNLRRRPVRSLIAAVAIAVEVALILMIVGLTNGMVRDNRTRMAGVGADLVVRPQNSSMFFALGGNTLPLSLAALLARQPGVKAVAPVALQINNKSFDTISGIRLSSFDAVSGGFVFLHGGPFHKPYQAIVDDLYARSHHAHVGQQLLLLGHEFQLTGIFEQGKGSRIYVPLATLNYLTGAPDKAAMIYIKLKNPAQTAAVLAQMRKLLPGYNIVPMKEFLSLFTASHMPGLPLFQHVMISIGVLVGFLVIFLSMYTTILERTREIGILKAMGASRAYIVEVILRESLGLALTGIVAGVAAAWLLRELLARAFPTLPVELTLGWQAEAALIAIVSSLIGAVYPAWKAARQDPIAALAYE